MGNINVSDAFKIIGALQKYKEKIIILETRLEIANKDITELKSKLRNAEYQSSVKY